MRISFDLDDTLICYYDHVPREPRPRWPWRWLVHDEPLRAGARELIHRLQSRGCEVCIYTTSHRDPLSVRWWLRLHGVRVSRVINQDIHDFHLRRSSSDRPPSKNPRAFGIDLHVDDSEGVQMEGKRYGFSVIVVALDDHEWHRKVLAAVEGRTP
jgi:hypothetical protein